MSAEIIDARSAEHVLDLWATGHDLETCLTIGGETYIIQDTQGVLGLIYLDILHDLTKRRGPLQ